MSGPLECVHANIPHRISGGTFDVLNARTVGELVMEVDKSYSNRLYLFETPVHAQTRRLKGSSPKGLGFMEDGRQTVVVGSS
jgi:hypothetical protein